MFWIDLNGALDLIAQLVGILDGFAVGSLLGSSDIISISFKLAS